MSENPYVMDLLDQLQEALVCLAPLPNGCSCRWAPWTARRLRRQTQAVLTAACALRSALEHAEQQRQEALHYIRLADRLLAGLLPAAQVPDETCYRAYAEAWLPGLTDDETQALCQFFGCTAEYLPDHVTHWAFSPPDQRLLA
ncbi:MAG: hypothetical protein M1376_22585 [Planctomycetes bacterium]|nr:hypothetical protein [Planctomycetota bacterium]